MEYDFSKVKELFLWDIKHSASKETDYLLIYFYFNDKELTEKIFGKDFIFDDKKPIFKQKNYDSFISAIKTILEENNDLKVINKINQTCKAIEENKKSTYKFLDIFSEIRV